MDSRRFQLFSGTVSKELAARIAFHYGCELGKMDLSIFADGELQPRIGQSIRGDDVFIVQSTLAPGDNMMELLLMIDAVKRSSAKTINVVIPYFGYARQDRKDKPRVSIGAKLMANLLTAAGANRVVTMDLHSGQIQAFFDIPLDNLDASGVFIPHIENLYLPNLTIASPDMGGSVRARMYAKHLKASIVLVDKQRERANEIAGMQIIGDVRDRNVVIVDDICDTAGTLTKAADYMMECGALSVRAAITHAVLSGNAVERIENSLLQELLVTDTIPIKPGQTSEKIKRLSIAPIFAKALSKIFYQESVSSLFLT